MVDGVDEWWMSLNHYPPETHRWVLFISSKPIWPRHQLDLQLGEDGFVLHVAHRRQAGPHGMY